MVKELKIKYGFLPLKKGERRPTMQEAIQHAQVRYFGINKIDPIIIANRKTIRKPRTPNFDKIFAKLLGLKTKRKRLLEYIKYSKNSSKVEKSKAQLTKTRNEIKKIYPTYLKLFKKKIKEQEARYNDEASVSEFTDD